ncbi:MAG: hypothetical protein QOJ99_2318, partial [Bryobacterales bacterium]|nr:hypothetical protein [Bryobacterales bacterium]
QVRGGDLLQVEYDDSENTLTFAKTAENMPAYEMIEMADPAFGTRSVVAAGATTGLDYPNVAHAKGRGSR